VPEAPYPPVGCQGVPLGVLVPSAPPASSLHTRVN